MSVERTGPLTRAQRWMWLRGYWREHNELIGGWIRDWEFPAGERPTAEQCRAAFVALVATHEILRTTFHLDPAGEPYQVVHDPGSIALPLLAGGTLQEDPWGDAVPTLVGSRTRRPPWHVRMQVEDGRVLALRITFDHIVFDGIGLANLRRQFDAACRGEALTPPRLQPVDRAVREQRRQAGAPPRTDPFARGPQLVCPPQTLPADPARRYLTRSVRYDGLPPLVDAVCRAAGVSRSTVLLGALVVSLCRLGATSGINLASYMSHRLAHDTGVECQMRPVDLHLAVDAGAGVGEVLRGVQAQLLDAYAVDLASGPVTPGQRARTNHARGAAATIPLFYNFQGRSEAPEGAPGAGEVRITSTDAWSPWSREGTVVCYVYFGADEVTVEHDLDTWLVTEDQLAAIVDGLPGLLRAWAADPSASAAGPATPAAPAAPAAPCGPAGNVLRTPHGWADTGLLRGVLADVLGTGVDVEPGADGGLLVTAAAPVERLAAAHDVLTAQAAHRLDLLLPTAYRSTLGAGATWHPAERAAEPPATVLERALCEAIGEVHGAEVADVSRSYVAVGGDVERAPAVVETLARRRVLGCASVHFTSPQSLRQVAAQLEIDTRAPSASPVHLS